MALIGHARVSTDDQTLAAQFDARGTAGCEQMFEEQVSVARANRPGLAEAIAYLCRGNTLVI